MYGEEVSYGAASRGWLVRSGCDPSMPGVVVLMEAFGLTAHVRRICEKLALAGYTALAPDFYRGNTFDYGDVDGAIGALRSLNDETVINEIDAAIDALNALSAVDGVPVGIVGFCMGGRLAFLTACRRPRKVQAVSSFYGGGIAPPGPVDRHGRSALIQEAERITAPLLLVYGARDQSIESDEHGRICASLSRLDKRYTLSVYPSVGHGFCCEDRPAFASGPASCAFLELIDFFSKTLQRSSTPR